MAQPMRRIHARETPWVPVPTKLERGPCRPAGVHVNRRLVVFNNPLLYSPDATVSCLEYPLSPLSSLNLTEEGCNERVTCHQLPPNRRG